MMVQINPVVVYNEIEPFAVAWLRELVSADQIASGAVDDRSIELVEPSAVRGRPFHAFAGLGAWSCALRIAGVPDSAPVWTGSCPCQPFSIAGARRGTLDERHLWPLWLALITECRPPVLFGEQVASPDGRAWFGAVRHDLEALGYRVGAADLCAASVGAPHARQRIFFGAALANAQHDGWRPVQSERGPTRGAADGRDLSTAWARPRWVECSDGWTRPHQPGTYPLAHGHTANVGQLRAYGNAIVPVLAAVFVTAFLDSLTPDLACCAPPPPPTPLLTDAGILHVLRSKLATVRRERDEARAALVRLALGRES